MVFGVAKIDLRKCPPVRRTCLKNPQNMSDIGLLRPSTLPLEIAVQQLILMVEVDIGL